MRRWFKELKVAVSWEEGERSDVRGSFNTSVLSVDTEAFPSVFNRNGQVEKINMLTSHSKGEHLIMG